MKYDVIIAGAGVIGSAIARELAQSSLRVLVLEKEEDVCEGTSKANSGIVHAGYDAIPGTLKAKLNVEGCRLIKELSGPLSIDYKNTGSLVLCFQENDRKKLEELYDRGQRNGVEGLQILEKEEIRKLEPEISDNVVCALYAPTAGIVCPFSLNIALAENAADNGVEFLFNTPAEQIEKTEDGWRINQTYDTSVFVNAAGMYADVLHNMVLPEQPLHITPRRGQYLLFDHAAASLAHRPLFQLPTAAGKGILVTPTCHNNLLIGPTAENLSDKEALQTTAQGLEMVKEQASRTIAHLPFQKVITSFAGLRASEDGGDFILQESMDGFFDAAGIDSPGLSSSIAIGKMMAALITEKLQPAPNPDFTPERKGFVKLDELSAEQWNALIKEDPDYGTIVCRCETISAGQIKDACSRSVPARSLDGVKRRVRAGMGRCQGGFCSPRTMKILADLQEKELQDICKSGSSSRLVLGRIKEAGYE